MAFSRDFDTTIGDTNNGLSQNPDIICKSSFNAVNLKSIVNAFPTTRFVRVISGLWSLDNRKKIFSMELWDNTQNTPNKLITIEADFPCPDNCIPPEPFLPAENSFNIGHLNSALAYDGIKILNVHSARRIVNGGQVETHSIYPVTGQPGNWDSHWEPTDPAYISISYVSDQGVEEKR